MAHQLQLGINVKNVYFVAHSALTLVFAGEKAVHGWAAHGIEI